MTKALKKPSRPAAPAVPVASEAPLSPHWAFVVQFRASADTVCEAGRIEHLVSGHTCHFQSLEELRAYLSAALRGATSVAKP